MPAITLAAEEKRATTMKTYRAFLLSVGAVGADVTAQAHICYVRADKYGLAWSGTRAGAAKKEGGLTLYSDVECKEVFEAPSNTTCVRIEDIRPRNVKLDKAALQEILNDDSLSDTQKIAAIGAFNAGTPFTVEVEASSEAPVAKGRGRGKRGEQPAPVAA